MRTYEVYGGITGKRRSGQKVNLTFAGYRVEAANPDDAKQTMLEEVSAKNALSSAEWANEPTLAEVEISEAERMRRAGAPTLFDLDGDE